MAEMIDRAVFYRSKLAAFLTDSSSAAKVSLNSLHTVTGWIGDFKFPS